MGASRNPVQDAQREQGPDTLPALRDMLIQDPRIGGLGVHANGPGVHPNGNGSSTRPDDTAPMEIHDVPSIAPTAPSIVEPKSQQASLQSETISRARPSVGKRALRSVALGFIVLAIGGSAFALLSYDGDKKRNLVREWDLSRSWVSSALHNILTQGPSQDAKGPDQIAEPISKPLDKTPSQNTAVLPATPGINPAPASVASGSSFAPQHQLEFDGK